MIRTYTLDCHAANPQMPLEPVCPYAGSAATFVLVNLPRPHGKQRIDAVTLSITNADAAVSAHPATREGSSWVVTVPASAIGPAGNVREAIIISASGVDEQNRPVPAWIVAVADLRVKNQDGTAVPGEPRVLISWFESRPANPRGVFICPNPDGQAMLDLYDGHNYRPLVTGVVTLDNTVTKDSANPVKSSGIWSAVWGALEALPTGFSSLYDWCAAQIGEKRDKTDRTWTDEGFTPWTCESSDTTLNAILNDRTRFPKGAFEWIDSGEFWEPLFAESSLVDGYHFMSYTGGDLTEGSTNLVFLYYRDSDGAEINASATRSATQESKFPITSKLTAGGLAKFGADGELTQAEKSSTSSDPVNADYRDPQDNTCHKTEFGEWTSEGAPTGVSFTNHPQPNFIGVPERGGHFEWMDDSGIIWSSTEDTEDVLTLHFGSIDSTHRTFISEKNTICTDGKKFVTEDVAARQSDIFGNDGKPSDTFATNLLGKQVAKEAIDNRTKASASAITGDALTLPDGGVVSASSSAPTITFGTARQDGLRFCELYITNPDTAADGAIVSISGKVYSDISLTELPKLEKGATYYFTFAEFKVTQETVEGETVSVSHWKVSKQKLDAMGGDIPTPTAA